MTKFAQRTQFVLIATALAILVACDSRAPSDATTLILEDATDVTILNFKPILHTDDVPYFSFYQVVKEAFPYGGICDLTSMSIEEWRSGCLHDTDDVKHMLRNYWDVDAGWAHTLGTHIDSVAQEIYVEMEDYTKDHWIIKGEFDFDAIRTSLEELDFNKSTYRDFEIWQDENSGIFGGTDTDSVVLLESVNTYVYGDTKAVKDVLRAMDRGIDSSSEMKRILSEVDRDAMVIKVSRDCFWLVCGVDATAITEGDENYTKWAVVKVYESEDEARSWMYHVEDSIEDGNFHPSSFIYALDFYPAIPSEGIELDEIKADGNILAFKFKSVNEYE